MKIVFTKLLRAIWYLFAAGLILAAILIAVAHLATPLLNKHRADLERWASERLQMPITIGKLHADWRGNIPELTLTQVVTLDKQTHRPAFEIQEVKFGFQLFTSLWKRKVVMEDIIISGAGVTIVQDADGGFKIKDLPVEKGLDYQAYQLSNILGWIFSQPYLSLRDIDVHFMLSSKEKRELSIKKVSLVNHGNAHKINGNFLLQQEIPTEVQAHIEWLGNTADPEHIQAKAYLDLEGVSLGQWLQGKNSAWEGLFSGWQIHQGVGGVGLWLTWEDNQLKEAQSVFQWYDLEFYSVMDKKTYPVDRLSGHLGWKRDGDNQIIAGDNLLINFPNHLWPATTFYVTLVPASTAAAAERMLQKKRLINPEQHAKASGKDQPAQQTAKAVSSANPYAAKLKEGLDFAEAGVKKSFAGRSAWRLQDLRIGYLDLQDLLPIVLANSSLSAEWHQNLVELQPMGELQNFRVDWQGDWSDFTGLTLSGEFKGLTFNPWKKFPGLANFNGTLNWGHDEGNLAVASDKLSVVLPTLFPGSLIFDQVKADIDFQYNADDGWSVKTKKALLANADVKLQTELHMTFPPRASPTIDLDADFSLARLTQIAQYLPSRVMDPALVAWLKDAFLSGRVDSGRAVIQGKLNLFPFDKAELKKGQSGKFEVSGELREVDFHYAPQWPLLQQVNGRLLFSGRAMTALIDDASLLDIPLKGISGVIPYLGEAQPQFVNLQAKVEADVSDGLELIHQSPLEEVIGKDLTSLQMKGAMKLALSLSIPLAKPEKTTVLGKAQLSQASLDLPEWSIRMDQINGAFQFTETDLSAKLLPGKLWGEPATLRLLTVPASKGKPSYVEAKVAGKVNVAKVQSATKLALSQFLSGTSAFQARLKLYQSSTANNEVYLSSNLQGIAVDLPAPFAKSAASLRDFALNFVIQPGPSFNTQLQYGDQLQAQLNITREQNARVLDIDSSRLKGRIRLVYPFDSKKPIEAQLDRLIVNAGNAGSIGAIDPHSLPPLNISSRQFVYGNKNLGQLNLTTVPKYNGLTIQNFSLSTTDYQFKSKGQWVGSGMSQHSQLQGTLDSSRVNQLLNRLGLSLRSLIVNKGHAVFDLQWKGAPYHFSLASMSGDFSFALEKGRIINLNESDNTKMDMGRMLSLFSLQTIPRRLSLDFSDLFEQGYSFDFMRGNFTLKQGSAFTQKPAVFEGPVAHITAAGRIGFLAQDYDLSLSISPYVTESLPVVAGALTLNPFVGAAAWLVNKVVLSKEVSRVVTYNYKVTGSWDAPVWRKVSGNRSERLNATTA